VEILSMMKKQKRFWSCIQLCFRNWWCTCWWKC